MKIHIMIYSYRQIQLLKAPKLREISLLLLLTTSFLLVSCSVKENESVAEQEDIKGQSAGKLMEIMHQGKVYAQVSLDTIPKKYLYGLGAIEDLKGELTVINGQPLEATVDSVGAVLKLNDSAKAALFVYSYVKSWDTLSITAQTDITQMLETELRQRSQYGPLPFMIFGKPHQLNYHIINFTGEKPNKSNHKQGALGGGLSNQLVKILGFYSEDSQDVYTHHGSKLHMHFMDEAKLISGHIDSLNLADRPIQLLLPKVGG